MRAGVVCGLSCMFCVLLGSWVATAQELDLYQLSLDELSRLVVTESKVSQEQATVTQKMERSDVRDFERVTMPRGNLMELLTHTSGMFVSPLSRNDPNWGSFGGLGPKYNGHLLDGLPIDSFADAMSLDPWALGQIEVQKGPASIMYANYLGMDFAGNETPLAGITNFILKEIIEAPLTRIQVGGGSYGTFEGRVFHQDRRNNINYFFGASLVRSDYTDYGTRDSWLAILDDPQYLKIKLYAKLTYLFDRNDHRLSLFAHHAGHTGDAGRPNRDFDHRYGTVNLAYSNRISERLHLQVKAGFRDYDRRWAEDRHPIDLALREHDGVRQMVIPADATLSVNHWGKSLFTAGVDGQVATFRSYAEVDGESETGQKVTAFSVGVFLQEKLVLGPWVMRVGGRFHHTGHAYDIFAGAIPQRQHNAWESLLWSGGVRFNALSWLSLYANAGSSFVAPSAKQLGGTIRAEQMGMPGANGQLPSLTLAPEKGIGTDLGVEFRPLRTLSIGVRGFYNEVVDAIVENVVSASPSQTRSMNVGKARSFGGEVDVNHRVASFLEWFANGTVTRTQVEHALDPDQDGSDIPFVPVFMANLGLTATIPWEVCISPRLQVVGPYHDSTSRGARQEFGDVFLLNLRIEKSVLDGEPFSLRFAVDLNNMLNRQYEMPWQFQDPGFNGWGSVELTF